MSEEEKQRYLQHRAAIEQEATRRKQQLISTFLKNKLKHEEGFTRLNSAKINQQWRQTLRQIKCKELHDLTEVSTDINFIHFFFITFCLMNKPVVDNYLGFDN
ncbi:hypothetical protein AAG570_000197 [Ranatra chinensis]|uniref:Dynein regulatory complex protein 1/2 N-terminal domain-containing protein n=1 Tax=Ranatra chinensis TaxID=642074 RepID=A0ABD0YWD0_9HEMI